ncbi:unnamed protein product [Parnassius apollo]|uniref:(apollo) hypothetical protein n=1 Tax=Parnassius apollo TaxID=110799 RepID=A0A8S3W8P7_PARAO|nr:unnamed protein product [Parnassius apollo]
MDKSFDLVSLLKNHEKKHMHKPRPTQILSIAGGVQKRLERNIIRRKSGRLSAFDSIRNLPKCEVPDPISESQKKVEHRRMPLEKWKEEKEKKKKEAAAHKKKPFVAGIVHPPLKYVPPPPPRPMPSTSGRVTRSKSIKTNSQITQKDYKGSKSVKHLHSFAPSNASFKPPELTTITKLPTLARVQNKKKKIDITFDPVVPDVSQTKALLNLEISNGSSTKSATTASKVIDKSVKEEYPKTSIQKKILHSSTSNSDMESSSAEIFFKSKNKTPRKSKRSKYKNNTPENPIPKSESSSEERLRSPKSSSTEEQQTTLKPLTNTPMTPEQIAEVKKISPYVTLSRGKDNARKEMKKKMEEGLLDDDNSDMESVDYFRRQLDSEVKRITQMCETWDKISQQELLSEPAQEMVLGAVGQARLLVSQKLTQFGSLVAACECPDPTTGLVTPTDLHGFWDMVFMQVENVDMRFKKLEELRARNWVEETPVIQKKRAPKTAKNNSKPVRTGAARKAKKNEDPPTVLREEDRTNSGTNIKTFDAGFFCVRSPVKSPLAPSTPSNKSSLLKAVLSSEAKKASVSKDSTSLAMLRASIIGRSVESNDIALQQSKVPVIPINLMATPGRSILKSTNVASTERKSGKKSIKIVLFNNSDGGNSFSQSPEAIEKIAEGNIDSGLSLIDVEKESEQNKENVKQKSKLVRQNAFEDRSPVLTRSRRKSMNTPLVDMSFENLEDRKRSTRTEVAKENEAEEKINQTPKRSTRRRKSSVASKMV